MGKPACSCADTVAQQNFSSHLSCDAMEDRRQTVSCFAWGAASFRFGIGEGVLLLVLSPTHMKVELSAVVRSLSVEPDGCRSSESC